MIPAAKPMIPRAQITAAGVVPAFVAVGAGVTGAVTGRVGAGIPYLGGWVPELPFLVRWVAW